MKATGTGGGWLAVCLVSLCLGLAPSGCGSSSAGEDRGQEAGRTTVIAGARDAFDVPSVPKDPPKNLVIRTVRPGWGVKAREGDRLATQFVAVKIDGKPFESTWEYDDKRFFFHLGQKEASPGWEEGLKGMKVGERRELIIPGDMASRYVKLPPEESLVYVVELVEVRPPELDGRKKPNVVVPPGRPPAELEKRDLIAGRGPEAQPGDIITMNYFSRRYTGKPFSNSWDDGHPFRIRLGAGTYKSIPGWEEGLPGMHVGGRRELLVPPKWIVQTGAAPDSKPSDTLVYIVDLLGVTEPRGASGG